MTEQDAHEAGWLLAKAGISDVIDAVVAIAAMRLHADVVTSDRKEIYDLVRRAGGAGRVTDV
jgi:hypothetical protein